jgi:hypothetical protein
MSTAGSSTLATPAPSATILSTLHALLTSHLRAFTNTPTAPFLHPYAPSPIPYSSPWKGKGKSRALSIDLDEQLESLVKLRETIRDAKSILMGVGKDDDGRVKFTRALKEVWVDALGCYI